MMRSDIWNRAWFWEPIRQLENIQPQLEGTFARRSLPSIFSIEENEASYEVSVDLPGAEKESLKVTALGKRITIEARRNIAANDEPWLRRERQEIHLDRSLDFESAIDSENINAQFEDGVLILSIPKSVVAQKTEINIH